MDAKTGLLLVRNQISCPKGAMKTVVILKNDTYMNTVLKQQEDIIPPRKKRTKESKGDVFILVLPREAEEQMEQSLVAVCSFCRSITGAGLGLACGSSHTHTVALSSQDISSHSAARSFCPSALPPVWTADLPVFSLCDWSGYLSRRKLYILMWLNLWIVPSVAPGHLSQRNPCFLKTLRVRRQGRLPGFRLVFRPRLCWEDKDRPAGHRGAHTPGP